MNRLELIETPNRRATRVDRRQCSDRRRYAALPTSTYHTTETLRELLDQAHARIRALERAVGTLTKAV